MLQRARAILKEHFGYSSFKKGQEQINYTQILEKSMPWLTGLAHFAKHSPDGKVIHFRRQCLLNGF
jgi:hypothetical protein